MKDWTKEQWQEWGKVVDWSHRVAHEGAKKLLSNAGMPQETLTSLQVFNVQDDIAYAIRRGAMRILNQINGINDTGDF